MDDFGMLARDFGFRPQGKSAPMAPSRGGANNSPAKSSIGIGSGTGKSSSAFGDHDRGGGGGGGSDGVLFDDVFGGPPKYTPSPGGGGSGRSSAFPYDSSFQAKPSSSPVYDKPVYDDDIFDGLPGVKSPSESSAKYDDVFGSLSSPPQRHKDHSSSQFDDLLGNLGRKKPEGSTKTVRVEKDAPAFDDLLPGFGGGSSPSMRRPTSVSSKSQKPSSTSAKMTSNLMEDPFVVLESASTPVSSSIPASSSGLYTDPLDEISKFSSSGSTKVNRSPASGSVFDEADPLDSLGKSVPPASSESDHRVKDGSPLRTGPSRNRAPSPVGQEQASKFHAESFENHSQKKVPVDSFQEPYRFDMSDTPSDFHRFAGIATSPPSYASATGYETNSHSGSTPRHEENSETSGDIWLTVSEVPLFTQPTSAPPPSRPPPPRPTRLSKSDARSFGSTNTRNKGNDFSSFHNSNQYSYSPKSARAASTSPVTSQIDELENFAMGGAQNIVNEHADVHSGDVKANSDAAASAAAMKDAMDKAEAKFRHAKGVREREHQKSARSRESVNLETDEKNMQDAQEKELRERQERLERERQQKEKEEEEREQRRMEKEREQRRLEKAREMEREREKARQAVERATREARERAAAEARLRAERAAVEKAQAEARERAERAAVQRAQAEARERAAAEAKERAEKAAAEARERARASAADARFRAERASTERAAAAAARANQQKGDDDLESFFSMGTSRPSSAPRPRANSSDPLFDTETQSKGGPEVARRTSVGASSNIRKASSSTNIVDDLTSIFGAAPSSGDFQDIEGETEERRRARLERHQRTQERAAKALAEKNQRDLQAQRDQAERHRIAETLDVEIKRWAAGKEGNLRALLSTLQYVLWPECGWQPVSLTDMITPASVKKVYRKATLCIHPDKVQQKGANLQQKYVAEKVFDLLKEAWNKFNSEELF